MARIHYYVHGRGRGHATRTRAIVDVLRCAGHEVAVRAGDEAWPLFCGDEKAMPIDSVMPGLGLRGVGRFAKRVVAIRSDERPDLIVSDGDMPSVIGASAVRVPSIAVGHGLVFSHCVPPSGMPRRPWMREAIKARFAGLGSTRQVAVSFVPLAPRARSTTVVRPLLRSVFADGPRGMRRGAALCYLGPTRSRAALLEVLVEHGFDPTCFSADDPEMEGVNHHPFDERAFIRMLGEAQIVVATAGSQLISECLSWGIRPFVTYAAGFDEQRLNALMLQRAGLGDGCVDGPGAASALSEFVATVTDTTRRDLLWTAPDAGAVVSRLVDELAP